MDIRTVKHLVLDTGLREKDIRPTRILGRFAELCQEDCKTFFADTDAFLTVDCPGCGSAQYRPVTEKNGFTFNQCGQCRSYFVSPRPNAEMLSAFRTRSEAYRYKVSQFVPAGAEARRFHLVASFAQWLARLFDSYGNKAARGLMDVGPISALVLDEVASHGRFADRFAYRPHPLAEQACLATGAAVVAERTDIPFPLAAITATETIEHLADPASELQALVALLADGGMFFLTARTSSGFDLSILGPEAPYVFVPEHMNLLSEAGIKALLARSGLEVIEASTPGQLDVQFVIEAVNANPRLDIPAFARFLISERGEAAHHDFQTFLQKHRLSSHLRLAARKANGGRHQ
jgi:hypothetical protein